jgi:hypothetical protein
VESESRNLELWQALGDLTAGVSIGAIALYFSNQMTIKYLDERKEWLEGLALERQEWNNKLERLLDRYDTRLALTIETGQMLRDQIHNLRGDVQKALGSLESRLVNLDNRARGSGSQSGGGDG